MHPSLKRKKMFPNEASRGFVKRRACGNEVIKGFRCRSFLAGLGKLFPSRLAESLSAWLVTFGSDWQDGVGAWQGAGVGAGNNQNEGDVERISRGEAQTDTEKINETRSRN